MPKSRTSKIQAVVEAKTRGIIRGVVGEWKLIGGLVAVLVTSCFHSNSVADKAQAHAESGTNWIGTNLHSKTERENSLQRRIEQLEKRTGVRTNYNVNSF